MQTRLASIVAAIVGTELTGTWTQAAFVAPLNFRREAGTR
jgi:hypothetical protein